MLPVLIIFVLILLFRVNLILIYLSKKNKSVSNFLINDIVLVQKHIINCIKNEEIVKFDHLNIDQVYDDANFNFLEIFFKIPILNFEKNFGSIDNILKKYKRPGLWGNKEFKG